MGIQLIFVSLFFLNLVLLWVIRQSRKLGLIMMLALPAVTVFFPQPRFELDHFWWTVAGWLALAVGAALIVIAKRELEKNGAKWFENEPKTLVTTGPYAFLRHPIYLGLIFILVGWWWIWSAVYSFYFGMLVLLMIWLNGHLEDRFILKKIFGQAFVSYKKSTGMFWIK